mgnify:CR=1 FL=1
MFTAYKDAHVVVTGGANGIGKALGGSVAQLRRHSHFTGGLLKLLEQLTEKGLLTVDEAEKSRIELERKLRPTLLFA